MNWFGYKNISNIIITTIILVILSNTILISLFYYKNKLKEYDNTLISMNNDNIQRQKILLHNSVNNIIEMIEYKYTKKQLETLEVRNEILKWLKNKKYDKNKNNYIFVYQLLDIYGGDKFAKMIINPNRVDLIGKYLSTNYKDAKGFNFREKFLRDIRIYGDSTVTYTYKKTSTKTEEKISYFKYYKPLNWIIAQGIYKDDIKHDFLSKTQLLQQTIQTNIKDNILLFILFSIIAVSIGYLIGRKIQNIINAQAKEVSKTANELAKLNKELDNKVTAAIIKKNEQEEILMQKSKFIALGETISLIAHQWRQPISELGAIILNIKFHHKLNKLDDNMMAKKAQEIETLLEYMSTTIDDFRTFFKPNKMQQDFNINNSIQRVLHITKPMLDEYNIKIIEEIDFSINLHSYENEFEQVLLNLISNAKDALVNDKIKNPIIFISVYKNKNIYIDIRDNANGIRTQHKDKIFNPYFTTKDDANGTGIGLYMSKTIIEKNMLGKIYVKTSKKGSCFTIEFNK